MADALLIEDCPVRQRIKDCLQSNTLTLEHGGSQRSLSAQAWVPSFTEKTADQSHDIVVYVLQGDQVDYRILLGRYSELWHG